MLLGCAAAGSVLARHGERSLASLLFTAGSLACSPSAFEGKGQ